LAETERDVGEQAGPAGRDLWQRGHRGGFPVGSQRPPLRVMPRLTGELDGNKAVSLRTHIDHAFQCHGKSPGLAARPGLQLRRRRPVPAPGLVTRSTSHVRGSSASCRRRAVRVRRAEGDDDPIRAPRPLSAPRALWFLRCRDAWCARGRGSATWSRHSRRNVPANRSAYGFGPLATVPASGLPACRFPADTSSNAWVNLRSRSRITSSNRPGTLAGIHEQIAGPLGGPRAPNATPAVPASLQACPGQNGAHGSPRAPRRRGVYTGFPVKRQLDTPTGYRVYLRTLVAAAGPGPCLSKMWVPITLSLLLTWSVFAT